MPHDLRHYYLQQLGIEPWVLRGNKTHKKDLRELAADVSSCIRCPLHKTRNQTVFSRGNPDAKLMIIGEAPGIDDDEHGLPFVGKAGGLLNKMLSSVGLSSEDVYIANLLKCRLPDNRDPHVEEITHCSSFLSKQIALVAPDLILAVGHLAGQFLLNATVTLNNMRGKIHDYHGIPVLVSYHPVSLLHNPVDKKNAYLDLVQVKQMLVGV